MRWSLSALLVVLTSGYAGDWLSDRGDPQGSGWQRHGKALTAASVKNLKLLWKRQLDDPWLSSPAIIGPTITHRGVRELVFVAGAGDNLYAVDADLGALFWKRHFDVASKPACGSPRPATPVIEPDPDEDFSGDPAADDEDDDEAGPMRPLYAVDSDGRLHSIRVSDGSDISPPIQFMPPNAGSTSLNLWSGKVYGGTEGGCNGVANGLWSVDVARPGAKPEFHSGMGGRGVVIGPTGKVGFATTELHYQGRELLVTEADNGRLQLLDAGNLSLVTEYQKPHTRYNGTATRQDSTGARWVYAATAKTVMGFRLAGPSSAPTLNLVWSSDGPNAGQPVLTNGLVFLVTGSASLTALDAATGKKLYSSDGEFQSPVPYMAVANGHVCFPDARGILYCFGIPMER